MILRQWTKDDIKDLANLMNHADRSYLSNGLPYPYTDEHAQWWLNMVADKDAKEGLYRAVIIDEKIVGMVSLEKKSDVYEKDAEISYLLLKEYWGKGIITQAVREFCEEAFGKLDILRITGSVFGENEASKKVLTKAGFVLEGIMRNAVYKNEKVMDLYQYGLFATLDCQMHHRMSKIEK